MRWRKLHATRPEEEKITPRDREQSYEAAYLGGLFLSRPGAAAGHGRRSAASLRNSAVRSFHGEASGYVNWFIPA
jgi:hypothetical protein